MGPRAVGAKRQIGALVQHFNMVVRFGEREQQSLGLARRSGSPETFPAV